MSEYFSNIKQYIMAATKKINYKKHKQTNKSTKKKKNTLKENRKKK